VLCATAGLPSSVVKDVAVLAEHQHNIVSSEARLFEKAGLLVRAK
jgi:hypothetical protein